uniref:Uncharacterized protein n=1 Tax=Arundo donax TaxID=35708 RepID=A0A0A9CI61_ARUDO
MMDLFQKCRYTCDLSNKSIHHRFYFW